MKWYKKLLFVLLIIVFSPIIACCLVCVGISNLFTLPKEIKQYKNSHYYKQFELPFRISKLYSPEYRFFNSCKNRKIKADYFRQESNGLEYFIYKNTLYVFPDFDQIDFNEEKSMWQVDYDGEWKSFEESFNNIVSKIDSDVGNIVTKLLVERKLFLMTDLRNIGIPDCIFVTLNYETAFENEESPLKLIIPTNTQELYDLMIATPNLSGKFEVAENGDIYWDLYNDFKIRITVNSQDCYFGVLKKVQGEYNNEITHWHPMLYEVYDDVCKIGKSGNVLVIRNFVFGENVLYKGSEKECPYSPEENTLFGKTYYLKAK